MMLADTTASQQDAVTTDHQCIQEKAERRFSNHFTPSKKMEYALQKRMVSIEGGRFMLNLRQQPRISIDLSTFECEVLGWDISLPQADIGQVDRKLAKQFLTLFAKADNQSLSQQEQATWLSILDQVDYESFCFDRAAPRYMEGTLIHRTPTCFVEWLDGTREKIAPRLAGSLGVLDDGDEFGAYIQMDRNGKTHSIERVLPLVSA